MRCASEGWTCTKQVVPKVQDSAGNTLLLVKDNFLIIWLGQMIQERLAKKSQFDKLDLSFDTTRSLSATHFGAAHRLARRDYYVSKFGLNTPGKNHAEDWHCSTITTELAPNILLNSQHFRGMLTIFTVTAYTSVAFPGCQSNSMTTQHLGPCITSEGCSQCLLSSETSWPRSNRSLRIKPQSFRKRPGSIWDRQLPR